jgi:hypothetical protein
MPGHLVKGLEKYYVLLIAYCLFAAKAPSSTKGRQDIIGISNKQYAIETFQHLPA